MKQNPKALARALAKHGRNGDTVLAHITPKEAALLDRVTDGGSINPITGLPEFFDGDVGDPGDPGEGNADSGNSGGGTGDVGSLGGVGEDSDANAEADAAEGGQGGGTGTGFLDAIADVENANDVNSFDIGLGDPVGPDAAPGFLENPLGWLEGWLNEDEGKNLAGVMSGFVGPLGGFVALGNAAANAAEEAGFSVDRGHDAADYGGDGTGGEADGGFDDNGDGVNDNLTNPAAETVAEDGYVSPYQGGDRIADAGYTRGGLTPEIIKRAIAQQGNQRKQQELAQQLAGQAIGGVQLPGNY